MAVIGIDLGTTNSLACVWREGQIQLIPNSFGEYLTPSVVSISEEGEVFVGKIAREMLITRPEMTFREFKRDMGTDREYKAGERSYRAEELSAFVLRRLKEDAELFLGEKVTEAVISVPAYFNDDQRCATKNAGILAELHVERLINEPSAVALKYHMEKEESENFIIFDFGGGTLDVSLVEAFENMVEIQAVAGDNKLGGKDFNERIAEEFYEQNGLQAEQFSLEEQGIILKEAEELKKELSKQNQVSRTILLRGQAYTMAMTNQRLIHISADLFQRMSQPIQKVMSDREAEWEEIDKIILVGGSSKMPVVAQYIRSLSKTEVAVDDRPDESIAIGVGMAAAIKERKSGIQDVILADICPFSMGTEVSDGTFSPIINRNDTLPCSRTAYYCTAHDFQTEISFGIYQGENMMAADNRKLGELHITELPMAPRGKVGIKATFRYDINGILDVEIVSENREFHKAIINRKMKLTEEEVQSRLEELRRVTLYPVAQEKTRLLFETAERLYRESNPAMREVIQNLVREFKRVMETSKGRTVREAYVKMAACLDAIEKKKFQMEQFDESFWTEEDEKE